MNVFYDQTAKFETDTLFSPSVSHYLLSSSSLSAKGAKRTTPVSVRVGAVALRRSLLSSFLST